MDFAAALVEVKVADYDIVFAQDLPGDARQARTRWEGSAYRKDHISLGIPEGGAAKVELAAEILQPCLDFGTAGPVKRSGGQPPQPLFVGAVRHHDARLFELVFAPLGDFRHLEIGDGQKLVADLVLDGLFLRTVVTISQTGDRARENDEEGYQRVWDTGSDRGLAGVFGGTRYGGVLPNLRTIIGSTAADVYPRYTE